MFAAATSFFSRSAISQSYNFSPSSSSRSSTPAPPGALSQQPIHPSINIGLWKVQPATHKVTNKRVSIWCFDKRGSELERLSPAARDRALEVLKAEASALGRLRHPYILEMVEPVEETRTELTFATEPVLSSLQLSIPGSSSKVLVELDEVEIQKGIIQICKGLSFLHSSAQLIHSNISPESIIINGAGDWKISGLGLTIPLLTGGNPTRWEFPTFDGRVPSHIQRSFDYMAPEYALDEVLATASDLYSLGCLIYAVHCKGSPPSKNHGNLGALRDNAGRPLTGMQHLDGDLQALLRSLITRTAANRPTPATLTSHPFFSSLPISTLNFLDRSNFTAKTREEKISFMKGLTGVLGNFSEGLQTRKILPSLLEEMKDVSLLPYILPNVFIISKSLSPSQFAAIVLPSLKPLFVVKEPPQNMLTLLDNLPMLQSKTDKIVFREQVLPLVYNALDSDHAIVQERGLKAIPDLCESVDYAEVQGVMFPRVAIVFTKTRILSVKVATLMTFFAMVKTLDQSSLTQKLVPLLSKIRTKEPAVMMATLAVQEAMGSKVDREAVATLVLPQLWAMSIGPLLNVEQFERFMSVINKLSSRVQKEHNQFLRDSQRIEDRSATNANGGTNVAAFSGAMDFESLVGSSNTTTVKADAAADAQISWEDDVWGSILNNNTTSSPVRSPAMTPTPVRTFSSPPMAGISVGQSPQLGAKAITSSTITSSIANSFTPAPLALSQLSPTLSTFASTNSSVGLGSPPLQPRTFTPLQPYKSGMSQHQRSPPPLNSFNSSTISMSQPIIPTSNFSNVMQPTAPPPSMGGLLTPSKPVQPLWNSSAQKSNTNWEDFDPLA